MIPPPHSSGPTLPCWSDHKAVDRHNCTYFNCKNKSNSCTVISSLYASGVSYVLLGAHYLSVHTHEGGLAEGWGRAFVHKHTWGNCFHLQHLLFSETPKVVTAQYDQRERCDSVPISMAPWSLPRRNMTAMQCSLWCAASKEALLLPTSCAAQCAWGSKCFVDFVFLEGEKGMRQHYGFDGAETPSTKGQYGCRRLYTFLPDSRGQSNPILVGWQKGLNGPWWNNCFASATLSAVQSSVGDSWTVVLAGQDPPWAWQK